jgi:hypothetical protein
MKKQFSSKIHLKIIAILAFMALCGCEPLNSPYSAYPSAPPSRYPDPYYSGSDYNRSRYDYERERDIENERRETEREQRRVEEERRRLEEDRNHYRPPVSPPLRVQESCPPGYSPSEQKCSPEERRHGCKDVRLSGGLGCVHR